MIDALPPDLLDEGTTENAVRVRTAGQAGQWHPFLLLLVVPLDRKTGCSGDVFSGRMGKR